MPTTAANNIEKLIDVWAQQAQELETALLEVLTDTRLDTAVGVQLDVIGIIVGLPRTSPSDTLYRDRLQAQIATNLASGTIPELLTILPLVLGSSVPLVLKEYFPAAFEIEALSGKLPAGQGAQIAAIVKQIKAGGVKGLFRYYETDPVFRLDGATGSKFDGGFHFSTSI